MTLTSRESIAQKADAAAKEWTAAWLLDAAAPRPANPYDPEWAPEHHKAWKCSFERALLAHTALPETEGPA